MNIAVYCGSQMGKNPLYKLAATELGTSLAKHQIGIIYGGSKNGLMGTMADAALKHDGNIIGIIPTLFQKQEIAHDALNEIHFVENMHIRKAKMVELADGFIALPGGCGTLDEYFEVFTWAQIGLHEKPIVLLNIDGFYDALIQHFTKMFDEGFIHPEQCQFLKVASTVEEALLFFQV